MWADLWANLWANLWATNRFEDWSGLSVSCRGDYGWVNTSPVATSFGSTTTLQCVGQRVKTLLLQIGLEPHV
jgi:hypothetical protein